MVSDQLIGGLKNVKPGDLFYIPAINKAEDYGFVIARYIELIPTNIGHLIEVFEKFYLVPPTDIENVDTSRRLFRPIMCSLRFAEIPRWKVLFSDTGYDRSESNYENITFAFHNDLWIGGKEKIKPAYSAQLKEFEDSTCWRMFHIIFRVNAHLAGIFGPDESYDYHRVPTSLRLDNAAAKEKVIALAEALDKKFKLWEKEAKTQLPRKA